MMMTDGWPTRRRESEERDTMSDLLIITKDDIVDGWYTHHDLTHDGSVDVRCDLDVRGDLSVRGDASYRRREVVS